MDRVTEQRAAPFLTDGVVVLDRHAEEDVAAHLHGEDEETARRFGWWPRQSTPETVRKAFAEWKRDWERNGPRRTFAVRDARSRTLVGGCEFRVQDDGSGHVSYWTNASDRGRGYATAAVTLLCEYAASIGVRVLESHVEADNHASRSVAEKAGFTQADVFIEAGGTEMVRYVRRVL